MRGVSISSRPNSVAGKVANKLLEGIGNISFDWTAFSYIVTNVSEEMQSRVMLMVKRIIIAMCAQYESGVINDATRDAMRLRDAMDSFE